MSDGRGISGLSVGIITMGGIAVYAGIKGESVLTALREIAGGHPTPIEPSAYTGLVGGADGSYGQGLGVLAPEGGTSDALRARVVQSAADYVGDTYSQARRREPGFSDCSAFVDKALRGAGIAPPGGAWATTANYRMSGQWKTIKASQALPGDIAINSHHMVLVTGAGGASAVGQQRTGVNVKTGSVSSLFGDSYVYKTYTGYAAKGQKGNSSAETYGSSGGHYVGGTFVPNPPPSSSQANQWGFTR